MVNPAADFTLNALRIILIDIALAADNAVVIALAVNSLPVPQRRRAALAGTGGAITLRILITFFAARILELPFFKLAGGVLIFWVAVKLLADSNRRELDRPAGSLRQAIWMILVADITMSTDNILAVAAASKGSASLLITGLALSISFVVFMSGYLARIMDRYPIIVWAGAAVLGEVAGSMISTDPLIVSRIAPSPSLVRGAEIGSAALVLIVGWAVKKTGKKTVGVNVSK